MSLTDLKEPSFIQSTDKTDQLDSSSLELMVPYELVALIDSLASRLKILMVMKSKETSKEQKEIPIPNELEHHMKECLYSNKYSEVIRMDGFVFGISDMDSPDVQVVVLDEKKQSIAAKFRWRRDEDPDTMVNTHR